MFYLSYIFLICTIISFFFQTRSFFSYSFNLERCSLWLICSSLRMISKFSSKSSRAFGSNFSLCNFRTNLKAGFVACYSKYISFMVFKFIFISSLIFYHEKQPRPVKLLKLRQIL